jgi:hypothetical protein
MFVTTKATMSPDASNNGGGADEEFPEFPGFAEEPVVARARRVHVPIKRLEDWEVGEVLQGKYLGTRRVSNGGGGFHLVTPRGGESVELRGNKSLNPLLAQVGAGENVLIKFIRSEHPMFIFQVAVLRDGAWVTLTA